LRGFAQIKNSSFVFQTRSAKVKQERFLHASYFHFIDDLRLVRAGQLADGFQLHQHIFKTNKICTITAGQFDAFVNHRQRHFALEWNLPGRQLNRQCFLINRFQKSVSQFPVNFHRRANDRKCFRIAV